MDTPICDFVENYKRSNPIRLHMPGHKGKCDDFKLGYDGDLTEVDGADVLYNADGIIAQSQVNAASIFGAKKTLYSTEGSSLSIRAMVYLAAIYAKSKGRSPVIVATRNAHKSFINACAIMGVEVVWAFEGGGLLDGSVNNRLIEALLCKNRPIALYVTSPDYLGNVLDISLLRRICDRYSTLLFVDNAHGAYLGLLEGAHHPIKAGAHLCCDSAHKTLPVLTGGGYLHFADDAPRFLIENGERAMGLFASTSPSYLILQSLDRCNRIMTECLREKLIFAAEKCKVLKKFLTGKGYTLIGDEPLKITIAPKGYGYTGDGLKEYLLANNVVCEFSDPDYVVMMFSASTDADQFDRVAQLLDRLSPLPQIKDMPPVLPEPRLAISPQKAVFMPASLIRTEDSLGRILASSTVNCPPAVPIVVCGEVIGEEHIRAFKYYGIKTCFVVDGDKDPQ